MFMEQENKGKFQTLQNTSHTDSGNKQLKIYNYNYNYDYNYITMIITTNITTCIIQRNLHVSRTKQDNPS